MKRLFLVLSLLLGMVTSTVAVSAQVDGVEAPDVPEMEIEGVEFAYSRSYSVDFMAIMEDPEYDPEDTSAMMRSMSIQGIQFESEDAANAYMDQNQKALDEAAAEDPEAMGGIAFSELEGFDVDGMIITMDMPDIGIAMVMVVFADGDQVFQVSTTEADVDTAKAAAESLIEYIVDNDAQDEEITFNEDGTSTGGMFDRMPAADDELVGDLTTVSDMELIAPGAE